jgi:hypothetical protein
VAQCIQIPVKDLEFSSFLILVKEAQVVAVSKSERKPLSLPPVYPAHTWTVYLASQLFTSSEGFAVLGLKPWVSCISKCSTTELYPTIEISEMHCLLNIYVPDSVVSCTT